MAHKEDLASRIGGLEGGSCYKYRILQGSSLSSGSWIFLWLPHSLQIDRSTAMMMPAVVATAILLLIGVTFNASIA